MGDQIFVFYRGSRHSQRPPMMIGFNCKPVSPPHIRIDEFLSGETPKRERSTSIDWKFRKPREKTVVAKNYALKKSVSDHWNTPRLNVARIKDVASRGAHHTRVYHYCASLSARSPAYHYHLPSRKPEISATARRKPASLTSNQLNPFTFV